MKKKLFVGIAEKIPQQNYMNVWIVLIKYVMSVPIFVKNAENIYVMAATMIIRRIVNK